MNRKSFIDVDEFILRLEWLKEWMAKSVDNNGLVYVPGNAKVIRGMFSVLQIFSFEEYCKYKQSL